MSRDNEADVTDVDGDETVAADVEHTSGEADDTTAEETLVSSHAVANDGPSGTRGLLRGLLVPLLLGALLLVSAGATTWIYFAQYRSDQAVGDAVKARVMQSASDGTVSLLSYSPETLDKDFANAKTHLTGDFLNYYTQFTAADRDTGGQAEVGEDVGRRRAVRHVGSCSGPRRRCCCSSTRRPPARRTPTARSPRAA